MFLLLSRLRSFLSPSTSPFTLCSRGTLLGDAPCSKRLLTFASPPAPCSFISYYRNPPVYPFSHPRSGLAFDTASLRRIAYYMLFLGAGRRFPSRAVESTQRVRGFDYLQNAPCRIFAICFNDLIKLLHVEYTFTFFDQRSLKSTEFVSCSIFIFFTDESRHNTFARVLLSAA